MTLFRLMFLFLRAFFVTLYLIHSEEYYYIIAPKALNASGMRMQELEESVKLARCLP